MIFERKKHHNGIDFIMYEVPSSRGECATQNGKYHLTGRTSITKALNQYKYGDEIIIQVFDKAGSIIKKKRVNENYDRIQIFFKREDFEEICRRINNLGICAVGRRSNDV